MNCTGTTSIVSLAHVRVVFLFVVREFKALEARACLEPVGFEWRARQHVTARLRLLAGHCSPQVAPLAAEIRI